MNTDDLVTLLVLTLATLLCFYAWILFFAWILQ